MLIYLVSVMFQIVCALVLDVLEALQELELLWGVPPNVQLSCEPCGHLNNADIDCVCLSSDRTGTYVHELSVALSSPDSSLVPLLPPTAAPAYKSDMLEGPAPEGPAPEAPSIGRDLPTRTKHPCLVPFVSYRADAYGRLLLATYVSWQTGHLTTCDWLRPVTRGGW